MENINRLRTLGNIYNDRRDLFFIGNARAFKSEARPVIIS